MLTLSPNQSSIEHPLIRKKPGATSQTTVGRVAQKPGYEESRVHRSTRCFHRVRVICYSADDEVSGYERCRGHHVVPEGAVGSREQEGARLRYRVGLHCTD